MQFAVPPSKASRNNPIYAGSNRSRGLPWLRRVRLRPLLTLLAAAAIFLYLLSYLFSGSGTSIAGALPRKQNLKPRPAPSPPAETPDIVLVTAFDQHIKDKYERTIAGNRHMYANKHGYGVFFANKTDYDLSDPPAPSTWAKIPAMRHAMTIFPYSTWFFYLDQHALVMRPELSLEEHLLSGERLRSLMLPDKPVVPPDSVIRTYRETQPDAVDAVFTQDSSGLGSSAFVLRRGAWSTYFLDAWFDPLYRSYNFAKAEAHALEHLVQWHGTVLLKFILVPQRTFNAYTKGDQAEEYRDGDFVANLHGCDAPGAGRSCEEEIYPLALYLEKKGFPPEMPEQ